MSWIWDLPLVLRCTLVGGAGLGALGGLVGLALGLTAHPATAWFAVLEVGVPAGYLGALLGLAVGALASLRTRARERRRSAARR